MNSLTEADLLLPFQLAAQGHRVGPPQYWHTNRTATFSLALYEGLQRHHDVLDVGSGLFRVGKPFVAYLEPGRYCGIEPDQTLVEVGRREVLGDLDGEKQPVVHHHDSFSFSTFGRQFDFVVARSIWSHAARHHIRTMLDEFKHNAKPGAKFLASYYRANWWNPLRWPYYGRKWKYRGQTLRWGSRHMESWLRRECHKRRLDFRASDWPGMGQPWVVVTK